MSAGRAIVSAVVVWLVAAAKFPPRAWADPQALSPNAPVQVEDALVVPYGVLQLQGDDVYTRNPSPTSHGESYVAEPVVKIGALPGLQLDASLPYTFGTLSSPNNGLVALDALYDFNPNSTFVPAFAVHGYVQTGVGPDTPSTQYTLRAIATKYLWNSDQAPRLHVNLTWVHITGPSATERADQYSFIVGYSQLVTAKVAFVADYVHGQLSTFRQDEDVIDAGLTYQINDDWTVEAGGGAGVAEQALNRRVFLVVQRNFELFGPPSH